MVKRCVRWVLTNWYRARLQGTPAGAVFLEKMHKGKLTTLDSAAAFPSDPDVLRVKCVGSALEVWYNPAGTPGAATLSATDGDIGWGGAALSGWDALFDNLKVGYDADDDDDLDGSDDVVLDEDFSSTSVSPTHDDAGNLTKDADYAYVYDGWNNLVKVRAQNDADVVVGVYAYYADNRRASKVVSNRGDLDGVTYFFYDGLREIEERNGSEQVTQQYLWGHEYIDQLLMIRGAGGTWFVHQDANWNVIALTTPNGDVAEEVQYQPYGSPQVRRHLAFGDADADGDVDSADNTAHTNALSTYNRTFDADFDGDVSNTSGDADQLAWEASYNDPAASTTMVVANRGFSPTGNPFLFTGRRLDAETGLYFYRFRTYHPTLKTFIQRDPLGLVDGPSMYEYAQSSPVALVDPTGTTVEPPQGDDPNPKARRKSGQPKHTPGKGHDGKSKDKKQERYKRKKEKEKQEAEEKRKKAEEEWEKMSDEARKLRPELNPDRVAPKTVSPPKTVSQKIQSIGLGGIGVAVTLGDQMTDFCHALALRGMMCASEAGNWIHTNFNPEHVAGEIAKGVPSPNEVFLPYLVNPLEPCPR
ncbi:MAG: RHS repeat-associated core domain-containing protein [Planctomycetia bacterium]|nr:RHS repeat-associated core domain-containing protein [Planctomycetia bacterium]